MPLFLPAALRYVPPLTQHQSSVLWSVSSHEVSSSTDQPSIFCSILSFCPQSLVRFTGSHTASLITKGGYLRRLSLDIPHSHLFINALLPWKEETLIRLVTSSPPRLQIGKWDSDPLFSQTLQSIW